MPQAQARHKAVVRARQIVLELLKGPTIRGEGKAMDADPNAAVGEATGKGRAVVFRVC